MKEVFFSTPAHCYELRLYLLYYMLYGTHGSCKFNMIPTLYSVYYLTKILTVYVLLLRSRILQIFTFKMYKYNIRYAVQIRKKTITIIM